MTEPTTKGPFPLTGIAVQQVLQRTSNPVQHHPGPVAPPLEDLSLPHLTDDSRTVQAGSLFVAIDGASVDGHRFLPEALDAGAAGVVCEHVPDALLRTHPDVHVFVVPDTRRALADVAVHHYGQPSDRLKMLGVTGTNGKTTVAYLLHDMLTRLEGPSGLISTIEVRMGNAKGPSSLTTPGPIDLQRTLHDMHDAGCTACAMEVSSHALDQQRVRGIEYDVALFTNLTTDHLDYHGTFANYRRAKKRLFDGLRPGATAVLNADDPAWEAMAADTDASVCTYGRDADATIPGTVLDNTLDGLRMSIDGRERTFRLVGGFNAYNLLAAYSAGCALGYDAASVLDALADAPPVPGRFETIAVPEGPTAVVDYAHTPDALENVLRTLRSLVDGDGALWCVFGCGGDRDTGKRPLMGRIAERLAHHVLVTSDNPRTEDPGAILSDIRAGIADPDAARWIVDRRTAIETALRKATPSDVVLIAGKGHETEQVIGTDTRPFDDRAVVRAYASNSRRTREGSAERPV